MRHPFIRRVVNAFTIILMVRLLVSVLQLPNRHGGTAQPVAGETAAPDGPTGPAKSGDRTRFAAGDVLWLTTTDANRAAHPQILTVELLERDGVPLPDNIGCTLDLAASAGEGGGSLTLRGRTVAGNWVADWDGNRTVVSHQPLDAPDPDPRSRAIKRVSTYGADCGHRARLVLSPAEIALLADLEADRPMAVTAAPRREGMGLSLLGAAEQP